jgi:dephospho-CoA kinase
MSLRVGLTGGLASGKSTVAQMFAAQGVHLMQADPVAHELMKPGEPVYDEVVRRFGPSVVHADGSVDRQKLAEIAFGSGRIDELNRIVHPAVGQRMREWINQITAREPDAIVMFEAALILEAGLGKYFDKLVVVSSRPQQKLERFAARVLENRDAGAEERSRALQEAERRLGAQISEEEKIAAADYVIDNSGTLAETERQVNEVLKQLKALARTHNQSC